MSFVKYACWNADEIDTFVRTTALEGDKAVFLGVHLPIAGFELVAGNLPEPTEESLFQELHQRRPHVLALVEGEPGSGKSHLIQWLRYRWPGGGGDHVVIVPRSDGSLLGALERLRNELGEPFAEPLRGLGQVAEHSLEGRAQAFLGQMVTFCQKTSFAEGVLLPKHADWLDRTSAWRILNHNALRSEWQAPREIMDILGGAQGKRDQRIARFTPAHVVQMVELVLAHGGKIGSLAPQALFVQLQREVNSVVRGVVKEHRDDVEVQFEALGNGAPSTRKLLEALDARCEYAVQGLLGIQRDELQKRFLEVRRRLRTAGRRLVLLLEDITNLQGVDRQLIEALLPSPATPEESDLCDLVAVLGVTPQYKEQFIEGLGNLRDRLAFHIQLTTSEENEVLARSARFLINSEIRARFVATYLNSVRAKYVRMKAWVDDDPDSPRPNACERCLHRKPCHAAFGSVTIPKVNHGPVGLYPFTHDSIERFWSRLTDPERKRTQRTPRGLLVNVVSAGLKQGEALVRGQFPTEDLEHRNIEKLRPGAKLDELLEKVSIPEGRKRLARTIVWWGDRSDGSVRSEAGGRVYSGVPQGVMAAFALEWPGEGTVQPVPEDVLEKTARETIPIDRTPPVDVPVAAPSMAAKSVITPDTPPPKPEPSEPPFPKEWVERLEHLDAWAAGEKLVSSAAWESLLFSVVDTLVPEDLGVPRWLWEKTLTEENVVLEDTRNSPDSLQLVVKRGSVVHHGLTALAWLRHGRVIDEAKRVEHFGNAARFQAALTRRAVEHVRSVEVEVRKYIGGDPGTLAVKALVVLAWLSAEPPAKGAKALPAAPHAEQWHAALRKAPLRPGLKEGWKDLGEAYGIWIDGLRDIVAETERVGPKPIEKKYRSLEFALVDPRALSSAVREIVETPAGWAPTQKTIPARSLRQFLAPIHDIAGKLHRGFLGAIKAEDEAMLALMRAIDGHTGGNAVEGFLERTRKTVEDLQLLDPNLVPVSLASDFSQSIKQLSQQGLGLDSDRLRAADDAMLDLADAPRDADVLTRLTRVVGAPRLDIEALHLTVDRGVRAIRSAHDKASSWVAESGVEGTGGLEAAASRIDQAAKKVISALGKGGGDD